MPDLKRRRGHVTAGIGAAIFLGGAILLEPGAPPGQ